MVERTNAVAKHFVTGIGKRDDRIISGSKCKNRKELNASLGLPTSITEGFGPLPLERRGLGR
jgi:hypothetical protein